MSEEKAWSFEKTWHYQQGALFLKEENSSLEWKKNLAEYFFRHGTVKGQELGIEQMQQELTDLKAKYQKAVEALKFYGDSNNWGCDEGWDGYLVSGVISIKDQESIGTSASFEYGGKLARQTIAELVEKD